MVVEYLHLASSLAILYASLIPFYLAKLIYARNKKFFLLSLTFGLSLAIHGVYHMSLAINNKEFSLFSEFLSAVLILLFIAYYMVLNRGG